MTTEQTIKELEAMRVKVIRELPHINCKPNYIRPCTCYKSYLNKVFKTLYIILERL